MPQSFVRRDFSLNVASTSPRGARPALSWVVVLGGWTLFGLASFGTCLVADVAVGDNSMPWPRLLAYSLGAAWIWAALTPAVLWLTRAAAFAPGQWMRSAVILGLTGAGFAVLSITLQTMLASATGIVTSGSSLLLPRVENSLLAYGALVVLGQASSWCPTWLRKAISRTRRCDGFTIGYMPPAAAWL